MKRLLIILLAVSCMALTPAERKVVEHARSQLVIGQEHLKQAQTNASWATGELTNAWAYEEVAGQQIKKLGTDIKTSHDNEKRLGDEVAKMKPVYDAVTRWFSLGAFVWGFQQLLKHLIILALFGGVIMLVIWGLSFVFPFLMPFIRMIGNFFAMIFRKIGERFKK